MDIVGFAVILVRLLAVFILSVSVFRLSATFLEVFGYDEIDDEIDSVESKF